MSVRVRFRCPRDPQDEAEAQVEAESSRALPRAARCAHCGDEHALQLERLAESGGLAGCLACGHPELYTQKDFPRALGIGVVVAAALAAPFTYYASLGVAALIDAVLYRTAPDVVVCYVCHARHRGFAAAPKHPRFDREIEERLKFGARAVMGKPMRPSGTAGAPEPEH